MIREQWQAASTLLAGIVQRLGTNEEETIYPVIETVSYGDLVQVELMMVFGAIQSVYRAGRPLVHDTILSEVQAGEPGGRFGLACGVFEQLWENRSGPRVESDHFNSAVALLARIGAERQKRAGSS